MDVKLPADSLTEKSLADAQPREEEAVMKQSCIHIYCGDGKGKSTAAMGLALRAAGSGEKVLITQFLKDGTSSELKILKTLPQIKVLTCEKNFGFFWNTYDKCCLYGRKSRKEETGGCVIKKRRNKIWREGCWIF